ncbi:hypothetical protein BSFA1_85830 (plasmid) [Burkholderia sp. SFA1]|nr:hypothetical protein BSFA1_85830 [Burkholderia sp. SFA1]
MFEPTTTCGGGIRRPARPCSAQGGYQSSGDEAAAFQDMVRFNKAIDQMLAESTRQYAQRTECIRDLFAAVLAHDLRSPLARY